jgi:peptidoglycan hydrolase CwlO-like protein
MLWEKPLTNAYCDKTLKRLEGYGATVNENANIQSLQKEVDFLRGKIVDLEEENTKLTEKQTQYEQKIAKLKATTQH